MKYCKSCRVGITGGNHVCPLCKNELDHGDNNTNVFPVIPSIYEQQHILFKILAFISVLASSTCLIINYLLSNTFDWSIIVIIGIIFFWVNLISSINKRNNPNSIIFNQVLIVSICCIILDYMMGFKLWSITYVLPFLCTGAMIEMSVASLILKYPMHKCIAYLLGTSIIGILQIVFILFKVIDVIWPSIICFFLSIVMINTILLFCNKKCRRELKKKFHI